MATYDISRAFDPGAFDAGSFYVYVPILATAQQGALALGVSITLAGQGATAQQGVLATVAAPSLIGQSATAQQGTITETVVVSLSGQGATAQQGAVIHQAAVALLGQAATAQQGLGQNFYALTGISVQALQGTVLPIVTPTSDLFQDSEWAIVQLQDRIMIVPWENRQMTVLPNESVLYVSPDEDDADLLRG